jgi:hypothetical protein
MRRFWFRLSSMKCVSREKLIVSRSSRVYGLLIIVGVLLLLKSGILTIPQDILAVQRLIRVGLVFILGALPWR